MSDDVSELYLILDRVLVLLFVIVDLNDPKHLFGILVLRYFFPFLPLLYTNMCTFVRKCCSCSTVHTWSHNPFFSSSLQSAVHVHPDPSGGADQRGGPQQTCMDVGSWNGRQWQRGLYWEWGSLDPRARRTGRGSAGHGPCPVSCWKLLIFLRNLYGLRTGSQ